jgi:serine/threonine protein kinase
LRPQQTIAHYRITSKLGEGGMGEVWRATDTKLARDVAIKVLPDAFAADPDRLARFTREAQVLASLNHPNIAAIYGVEDRALVMELVEGDAPRGPLSAEELLPLLHQLIDALEYAHDKGIVHRDLKPANLKLTPDGRLKVLDFGLAKALSWDSAAQPDAANSPTLTMRATLAGVIMGTAAYMAPEQARGQSVDKRADIWSFGVVLYELLTGESLFDGGTVSDTLAAVLTREPNFSAVPPRFQRLLRMCLARDPRQRLRDISGARLLLDDAPPAAARRAWAPWAVAAMMALALAASLWRGKPAAERPLVELNVDLGPEALLGYRATVAVSRDGSRVAYPSRLANGRPGLAVRMMNQSYATALAGTKTGTCRFSRPTASGSHSSRVLR